LTAPQTSAEGARPNTLSPQQDYLSSCAKCRNAFRLVEAAGDQRDTHFDL